MALGSSAPEILLNCIETVTFIDVTPGELGPSTIVGSAAFNLLIITAFSIFAVGSDEKHKDEIKKIDDVGVFVITSIFSVFAYVWMLICLSVWTPDEITLEEALITLFLTGILIGSAFSADRYRQRQREKLGTNEDDEDGEEEEDNELEMKFAKTALRMEAKVKGESYCIECVTGGPNADKATPQERETIRENFKKTLKIDNLKEVDMGQLLGAL